MKQIKLTAFELGSFLWILTAIFALVLAVCGKFFAPILALWFLFLGISLFFLFKKGKFKLKLMPKTDVLVLSIIIILGLGLSLITTPTIFGGRDEGTLNTVALMIAQDHKLKSSSATIDEFFKIYGPGTALNFPGFYYTIGGSLKTQFLPGYSSWVAIFASFFGYAGLKFANLFPFVTFLFSFYLLLKRICQEKKFAMVGIFLFATFLPITVFYKFALTEIFFGALIWFGLYLMMKYLKDRTPVNFALMFIPFLITPFVRIESLAIIFFMFLILILFDYKHIRLPRYQLMFVVLALIIVCSFVVNGRFFVDTFKNFATISPVEKVQDNDIRPISFVPDDWKGWYMLKILHTYNILPILVMATAMIVALIRKKKWKKLIPFFFLSPTLLYLVDANISLDHPWMLRRLTFSIIPLSVLYSVFLLELVGKQFKLVAGATIAILVVLNTSLLYPVFADSQNKNLLEQTEKISSVFEDDDLILVSRKASGSNWSLLSEPLRTIFNKQAVYFFNTNDYAKIDKSKWNRIFLIASEEEAQHYLSLEKTIFSEYETNSSIIKTSKNPTERPTKEIYGAKGYIYLLK